MPFWEDGVQAGDFNPFGEGKILGPARKQSGREPGASAPVDDDSFLYPGSGPAPVTATAVGPTPDLPAAQQVGTIPGPSGLDLYNAATQRVGSQFGAELLGMGQGLYGGGTELVNRGAEALGADPNRLTYDPALAGAAAAGGRLDRAGDALMALSAQSGPSAAEALLRSGTANAANQNLALANSGRGLGGGAAARRAAMLSNAQLFGRMNADLAALRAQETQQDLARRAGAASAAGQVAGAGGQLALGTGGYVTGARGQAEGLATERGLGMIGQGVGAMGTGAQAVGTGGQTALSAQELVGRANEAQLNAQVAREQNATNRRGQDRGLQGQEAQAEAQRQAGLVGMFATGIGSIFGKPSDRAAKTDITPVFDSERSWVGGKPLQVRRSGDIFLSDAAEPERGTAGNSWVGGTQLKVRDPETGRLVNATDSPSSGGGGRVPSEAETAVARAREDSLARATGRGRSMAQQFAEEMNMPHELGHVSPSPREAMRTIDNAPAYSFLYKDPERHGEGRRVGVMAQDLEKTPAGRQAVFRSPDGMRAVDTGELSTINTAALFGVQQRQDDLESGQSALADEIRRMRRMFEFEPPEVDRDALDAAAQRERSFGL